MKLVIDIDKGGESFWVYKVAYTGTKEGIEELEDNEGKGPWYLSNEESAKRIVDDNNKKYHGTLTSIEPIQVWL
jgi:hypothetical protein